MHCGAASRGVVLGGVEPARGRILGGLQLRAQALWGEFAPVSGREPVASSFAVLAHEIPIRAPIVWWSEGAALVRSGMRRPERDLVDAPAAVPVIDVIHAAIRRDFDSGFPRHTHLDWMTPPQDTAEALALSTESNYES